MTKEERMSRVCDLLFKLNREAILRDGDWWYGTDDYDFNFFDWGDRPNQIAVVVYAMTERQYFQYTPEQEVFKKRIFIEESA